MRCPEWKRYCPGIVRGMADTQIIKRDVTVIAMSPSPALPPPFC
jgi:hypothetical protein